MYLCANETLRQINGESLKEASDDYANELLRSETNVVRLLVSQRPSTLPTETYGISKVVLSRKNSKLGFGFTIVRRETDQLIFISDIVRT